ncbi:CDP-glycerol glycerophosphotransferase family protein [Cellulosimicrobium terreum]|nr:CDP-glycerol glycerophosphotransferase family protein [Cellulosimicrobium terreum]
MTVETFAPTLAVVVVTQESAENLPDFIAAVDAQLRDGPLVRVVAVDAGSSDGSPGLLQEWAARRGDVVRVLPSAGGVPAARNAALAALDGADDSWVTFPDVQDVWEQGFLSGVHATIVATRASVVLARSLVWDPGTDSVEAPRTGEGPFDARGLVVDVDVRPEPVTDSLRNAFVRLRLLDDGGVRFDDGLAAGFGDHDVLARVLAAAPDRKIGLARTAVYRFRRRLLPATGERAPFRDPAKFTTVLRRGHLRLLHDLRRAHGAVPRWAQHLVLDDLGTYFRADETLSGQMNAEMHHVAAEFHELVEQIVGALDLDVLESLDPAVFPLDRRIALRRGYRGETWHEDPVVLEKHDARRRLVRLSYRFTGPAPDEEILVDGVTAAPHHAKTRRQVYSGRTLVSERIMWVSSDAAVQVRLDGRPVAISRVRSPLSRKQWQPPALAKAFAPKAPGADLSATALLGRLLSPRWWANRVVRTVAGLGPVRRRYGGSWVLIDRVDSAHDNAEHLFKHLQRDERGIRSWFALERGSHDWDRLKAEGNHRLLAYGSLRWKLVCLNASHVISSQAGPYVYNPEVLRPVGTPSWRFVFLQHGVIATDLSRWLNRREFDLFVTTTTDEFASIAGDQSLYRFTTREVALTGLPRHDRLFRLDAAARPEQRRRILVLPTWREYLLGAIGPKGERELLDDFAGTTYAKAWTGLLTSPRLAELAREHDATIAFMPHPNVQPYLAQLDLPGHVEVLTYGGSDIQEVLVSARVVVTDFSSIVFDAAYVGRPIVYYQFDQAEAFGGTHTVRQGYFSYEEDGFGPVVQTLDDAVGAIAEIAAAGFVPAPEHLARMGAAFPARDDRSCARAVTAIAEIDRPEAVGATRPAPPAPPTRSTPSSSAAAGAGASEREHQADADAREGAAPDVVRTD